MPLACEDNPSAASPGGFVERLYTRVCGSTLRSRGLSYLALLTFLHTPTISLSWRKQLQEILVYETLQSIGVAGRLLNGLLEEYRGLFENGLPDCGPPVVL